MKKSENLVGNFKNEIYLIASLVTANKKLANKLTEETIITTKNSFYPVKTEERLLKIFIRQFKKHIKENETVSKKDLFNKCSLVHNLINLKDMERITIILRYYKNYEITKIAKLIGTTVPKVRTYLIQGLSVWTNTSKEREIAHLHQEFQQEISNLKININHDLSTYNDNSSTDGKLFPFKKKLALQSILLAIILIIGGTINEGTIEKTRASQGPDLIKIYEEGTLDTIVEKELAKEGFHDVYVYTDYISRYINLSTENNDTYIKQNEVFEIVEDTIKERGIDFKVSYDYFGPLVGEDTEVIEEENWEEKIANEEKIRNEIYENMAFTGYQDYIWQQWSEEDYPLSVPDILTKEERSEVIQKVTDILKKYDDNRKVYTLEYDFEEMESENRWYGLAEYMYEGLILGYPNLINEVNFDYLDNKMQINIHTGFFRTDEDASPTAREIKRSIYNFLQYEPVKKVIKEDKYIINVNAINQQVIETE